MDNRRARIARSRVAPPQAIAAPAIHRTRPVRPAAQRLVSRRRGGDDEQIHSIEAADQFVIDLLKAGKPPYDSFREGTHVHVSDIISKCARKIALIRRLGLRHQPRQLLDGHAITFAQGHAIHDFIKKRFVDGHPDKVWAKWECPCGATMTEPMVYAELSREHACPTCKKIPRKYHEVGLADDDLEVVGSPDLILYLKDYPLYYPIEIKSMTAKQWEELERPVPDHVIQALFYWKLMRERNFPLPDQLSILYVKKEYTFKLPYKEFIIHPQQQTKRLDSFVEDLEVIAAARNPKNPLPPRVTCGTMESPEAKQCSVCVTCFQLP